MDKLRPEDEAPSAEYDGPTINCKPILDIGTVQQWFKDVRVVGLTGEAAAPIAAFLNEAAFLSSQWKNTSEFNEMRKNDKGRQRMRRVSCALATLEKDIPALIDDTMRIAPEHPALAPVVALRDAVEVLAPGFQKFLPKGRGRNPESWHNIARKLGPMLTEAIKRSGPKRAGFGKVTSPAVRIMHSALGYLGIAKSCEAIVDAMRGRKRVGKYPEIPRTSPPWRPATRGHRAF